MKQKWLAKVKKWLIMLRRLLEGKAEMVKKKKKKKKRRRRMRKKKKRKKKRLMKTQKIKEKEIKKKFKETLQAQLRILF